MTSDVELPQHKKGVQLEPISSNGGRKITFQILMKEVSLNFSFCTKGHLTWWKYGQLCLGRRGRIKIGLTLTSSVWPCIDFLDYLLGQDNLPSLHHPCSRLQESSFYCWMCKELTKKGKNNPEKTSLSEKLVQQEQCSFYPQYASLF